MNWILNLAGFAIGNWQRIALYGIAGVAVASWLVGWGYMKGSERLYSYQAEQAQQAVRVVVKQGAVTERVVTKFVKVQGATRRVTQTVEKEVVRYVDSNPGLCLDRAWGILHDAAAANTLPVAPGAADAAGGAPTAAEALQAVTSSYAACHRTANRLDGLQEWVREQAKVRP